MLTGAQLRTVAYQTDDGIVCPDCLTPAESNDEANTEDLIGSRAICAYSADEFAGDDGLYCDRCGGTIVDPPELDYVVTITLTAASGVSAEAIESEIESWLDSIDIVRSFSDVSLTRD